MKTTLKILLATIVICSLTSCSTECETTDNFHTFMLLDVTDELLFENTRLQINRDLKPYLNKKGLDILAGCGVNKFSISTINNAPRLYVASDSIYLDHLNLSGFEIADRTNPDKLHRFVKNQLDNIATQVVENPVMTSATDIAPTLAKSMLSVTKTEGVNTLIVFSDLIVYNDEFNFYRKVPENPSKAFKTMLGSLLFKQLKEATYELETLNLIIVLQPSEKLSSTQNRELLEFWDSALRTVVPDITFTDSLSNL